MTRINAIPRSAINQPNGVAGLDASGYLSNIGEVGHPPQINGDGAIEAIVAHRADTLANLQALGPLPEGEIVVVKDGSGVPIGFRVGDEAETNGGYPITASLQRVQVTGLTLSSTSYVLVPGLTIALPANSLLELSGALRFGATSGLSYNFLILSPQLLSLLVRDGATNSQNVSGALISMTGAGGAIIIPPTVVATESSTNFEVYYQKISGVADKPLSRGDLVYRVLG